MRGNKSREEYVFSLRQHAVMLAKGILSGEIPVLDGSHWLSALHHDVDVEENDPDFLTFDAISSEIDALPIGAIREYWAPEALAKIEPEIQSAIA